jgi:pyrroloquinoline quinone biosynthesis protein B
MAISVAQADPYVLVLGVSQDAGHPQAGCEKSCCAAAWDDLAKRHHASSIAVIDPDSDQRWIFDVTPHYPDQARRLSKASPGPLSGVLLTHAHIGHYVGMVHLGPEVMNTDRVPLWLMPRMMRFMTGNEPWNTLVTSGNVVPKALVDGQPVQLNKRLSVTPIMVPHRDELSETVGFVVTGPSRSVLYLPDIDKWERWDTRIETWIGKVDIAMLDAAFYADGELPGRDMSKIPHPFISESMERFGPLSAELKARIRFTHMNHTNPALDPDSAASAAIVEAGMAVAVEGDRYPL